MTILTLSICGKQKNYGSVKMNNRNKIFNIALAALTAALYVILTVLSAAFGLSGGAVQIRLSEALCILPVFTPAAIPGLFIGCLLSNLLTGCAVWDIIFGSLATLAGAVGTYYIGKKHTSLGVLPPIIANTAVVPLLLAFVYSAEGALWFFFVTVFAGELVSCGILGTVLRKSLKKSGVFKRK